jgi:hypothetical protein
MARSSYTVGAGPAKVTVRPAEALAAVEAGSPVVLVGPDSGALGAVVRGAADRHGRERLLAAMVGDPDDPAVAAAAQEMAAELWPAPDGLPA